MLKPSGPSVWEILRISRLPRLSFFTYLFKKYGDVITLPGQPLSLIINQPEFARHILQQNHNSFIKKGAVLKRIESVLGTGFLTEQGPRWHLKRNLVLPNFQPAHIPNSLPIVVKRTNRMLDAWSVYAKNKQPINIAKELSKLLLGISGEFLFEEDLTQQAEKIIGCVLAGNRYASKPMWTTRHIPTPRTIKFLVSKISIK